MKKAGLFLCTVFFSSVLFGQTDAKFGVKGGLNIASTSNTIEGETGTRLAPNAGLLAHIHLSPAVSLQPELMYSGQGGEVAGVDLLLHYINVPVLVQYNFNNGFRLQTGPQVGFLVGVNDKIDGNETNIFTSDDFKSTDIAWSFGLGYLSKSGLGIDGRYNLGLTGINDGGGGKTTNRVIQLGLFYLFDHSHKVTSK